MVFLGFPSLFAREIIVIVEDTELSLPLEGAVIRSWDGNEYICDADGRAQIPVPDDRQIVINAAYPGYESGRLIIRPGLDHYVLGLHLSGIMEGRELIVEAARPGISETRIGRSVAISGREIAQTAEIGIIEDVMSSIKLLPGVGYAGFFNAQPSIRGGHPGDMSAVLDGFYIMTPYHWGGGYSIFDPRMVQSAQLSHGVFSTRYGHTISGLLDISTKNPSATEVEFELGASSSAAGFNVSFPLSGMGGILFMGRITFYDPIIETIKLIGRNSGNDQLEALNSIRQAPYIRSMTVTGNYRFADNLEFYATGFWGMDGAGATFDNRPAEDEVANSSYINLDWANYQGFITTALNWNPRNDMLITFSAGSGYEKVAVDGTMQDIVRRRYFSDGFYEKFGIPSDIGPVPYHMEEFIEQSEMMFNIQGRIDYHWDFGKGFIVAAGIQEMISRRTMEGDQQAFSELRFMRLSVQDRERIQNEFYQAYPDLENQLTQSFWDELRIHNPVPYFPDARNTLFATSGYGLVEYLTPDGRLNAELGLRIDHYHVQGRDFSLRSVPAVNPRLNLFFQNRRGLWSLGISAGTGLFSTVDNIVFMAEKQHNVTEFNVNKSWTSVLGAMMEFSTGINVSIEGYYKHIFERMYIPVTFGLNEPEIRPQFDGQGRVWGIDVMLQKLQSRFWDGWISYSFNHARYRDPSSDFANMGFSGGLRGNEWYFPSFHRYHNINLVLNIKPDPRINIYTRFGLASGEQIMQRIEDEPRSYPVLMYNPVNPSDTPGFIERYVWPWRWNNSIRASPTLPLDIKLSFFGKKTGGKARYEIYAAVENVLALVYSPRGSTRFNSFTGEIQEGSDIPNYGIPIPIPSFGFKISY